MGIELAEKIVRKELGLIIDTREQRPLDFKCGESEVFNWITKRGVPFGDYWAEFGGKEIPFCFERKALGDLFGTMTHGYSRFKAELERARDNNFTIELLVEEPLETVRGGYLHSKYGGDSMLKKLAMLRVRYGLVTHFFNGRAEMARYISEIFDAVRRNFKHGD